MAYFRDFSPYQYGHCDAVPGAQNVGWLALGHAFETGQALEGDLDLLWAHCKLAICATRGLHSCEFCSDLSSAGFRVTRNGETLKLGYSEIRVIGPSGQSYAAPSMIYHYISQHRYKPPDVFLAALRTGPRPPSDAYFEALRTRGLEWASTIC
ncbi:hypothetical protein SSBR45G_05090 [Bradyrhizobium sp. SSBR45G]|uniref:DUF7919 family protein n=1 Tax=unclassified Bradyrhizobium TaxID=2631580 RepID=UPI002342B6FF|nr:MULTISPECIES: hypothetical protein [unclassified Bradyrhizobium]GLH75601.1 hypothetical protein SSBR45G_05090 [Bradyrhizobium sp. SSBR45G]GLH82609.1 hypothetical protein SSBR45R_00690 [Bradyrhizobium sp. SSBR45R]